jgi:hypothetical protein
MAPGPALSLRRRSWPAAWPSPCATLHTRCCRAGRRVGLSWCNSCRQARCAPSWRRFCCSTTCGEVSSAAAHRLSLGQALLVQGDTARALTELVACEALARSIDAALLAFSARLMRSEALHRLQRGDEGLAALRDALAHGPWPMAHATATPGRPAGGCPTCWPHCWRAGWPRASNRPMPARWRVGRWCCYGPCFRICRRRCQWPPRCTGCGPTAKAPTSAKPST